MPRVPRRLALQVARRANGQCEYCQLPEGAAVLRFHPDHIIAVKHKGRTATLNLAWACFYCNSYKGSNIAGIDPVSGRLTRLFHPRKDKWSQHFEWFGAWVRGRNPVGRATVQVLNLNHPEMLAVRRELKDEGLM